MLCNVLWKIALTKKRIDGLGDWHFISSNAIGVKKMYEQIRDCLEDVSTGVLKVLESKISLHFNHVR